MCTAPLSRNNGVMDVLSIEEGLYLGHPTTRTIGQLTYSKNGHPGGGGGGITHQPTTR